jgi:S1-C subfamily serine protease
LDIGLLLGLGRVRSITPGSAAARAGFEIDDEVISKDGVRLPTDVERIRMPRPGAPPITFEVRRAGKTVIIEVKPDPAR